MVKRQYTVEPPAANGHLPITDSSMANLHTFS